MRLPIRELRLDQIELDEMQREPDRGLIESLREFGQLSPIHVLDCGGDRYRLADGSRRVGGARQLGWEALVAIVTPAEAVSVSEHELGVILNRQRESLEQLHLARQVRRVLQSSGRSQAALARQFRLNKASLCLSLKVLEYPELVAAVEEQGLEWSAAQRLTVLPPVHLKPLLAELRAIQAETGCYPPLWAIREMIAVRQGKKPLPAITTEKLLAVVDEWLLRDAEIEVRSGCGRELRMKVEFFVPDGDRAWFEELVAALNSQLALRRAA